MQKQRGGKHTRGGGSHDDGPCGQQPDRSVNLEQDYDRAYRLPPDEQRRLRKAENGVRRLNHEGKACLERYRLASMRIFSVVLESLTRRLPPSSSSSSSLTEDRQRRPPFVLERASIDEFYLDITDYCYGDSEMDIADEDAEEGGALTPDRKDPPNTTLVIGDHEQQQQRCNESAADPRSDPIHAALQRACRVSYRVRRDLFEVLGFAMSAGISTNKMMAKLAASYGKPHGQAVLHPDQFGHVMAETKVRKVRNFGGKLGMAVLAALQAQDGRDVKELAESATMHDLTRIPLPVLRGQFSEETAQLVFQASRGIDSEAVKETSGALVKSITAFKSFPATKSHAEVESWLTLLATEVAERVARDAARNRRYPKSCTLNFTCYDTPDGKPPPGSGSWRRRQMHTRSVRLAFPPERDGSDLKSASLVQQAMGKLVRVLNEHPLRGVGLSASNFESRGQVPEGMASIQNFFAVAGSKGEGDGISTTKEGSQPQSTMSTTAVSTKKRVHSEVGSCVTHLTHDATHEGALGTSNTITPAKDSAGYPELQPQSSLSSQVVVTQSCFVQQDSFLADSKVDKDMKLAKQLQASYDRENYILATANRRKESSKKPKTRRIDAFFSKRS